jgi:hypothetical protein
MTTYMIVTRDNIVLKRGLTSTKAALRWCIEHRINSSTIYVKQEKDDA